MFEKMFRPIFVWLEAITPEYTPLIMGTAVAVIFIILLAALREER